MYVSIKLITVNTFTASSYISINMLILLTGSVVIVLKLCPEPIKYRPAVNIFFLGGIFGRDLLDATAAVPHHRSVVGHHSDARIRGHASVSRCASCCRNRHCPTTETLQMLNSRSKMGKLASEIPDRGNWHPDAENPDRGNWHPDAENPDRGNWHPVKWSLSPSSHGVSDLYHRWPIVFLPSIITMHTQSIHENICMESILFL